MHSSFNQYNWSAAQVAALKNLLSNDDIRILSKSGGGNSLVYCIEANGKKWALKTYPPALPQQRNRLASELLVYQFLNSNNIDSVPSLHTFDKGERWLIIDWVDGDIPSTYSADDIAHAIRFLDDVYRLNSKATELPEAAEACLSLQILLAQINRRLENLKLIAQNEPLLDAFLKNDFSPFFEFYQQQVKLEYANYQLNINEVLAPRKRSLIPADFGFHNSLRDKSGKLYFFDFDYFGWDDPVKLLADIIWHPKMHLSESQQLQFTKGLMDIYQDDTFELRFHLTKPLFGLRWVLILLNEFIPTFWQNRQHAGTFNEDLAVVKQKQLSRAKALLLTVQQQGSAYEIPCR